MSKNEPLRVRDVMLSLDRFPVIDDRVILKEALEAMGRFRLGVACVVGEAGRLVGIITDGDLRRTLLNVQKPLAALFVDDAVTHAILSPTTIRPDDTLSAAVDVMGLKQVWDLPVVDASGVLVGLLHLHPAVKALLGLHDR